ncbi:helix-turn-helix transcriptional regulator [Bacteroides sp. 1001136B_160425_E2]|uniref:helix-turn-helix transcriptional regulator n=1 Tax=Bacteroides sp. 1001136B_160425_E2 TaxID=2787083 RepID=UPI001E6577AF|nr:helix-turn-helix domain-containing protein [Bacteroides sp. 1001136B_160425_E2]
MGIKVFSHSIKLFIMLYNNILHDDALVVQLTVSQIKAIIRDVLQESPSYLTSEKSETLTIEEVSELTGYKKATLYKLTHERKIPFHKPAHGGRRIFFKRAEINQWLESNLFETYEESFENLKGKKVLNSKLNSYEKSK